MWIWDCGSAAQLTRILTLPLMMAFVLSLIGRQIGSVSEAKSGTKMTSQAQDQTFWERAVASLPNGVLLLFDLGFTGKRYP